MLIIKCSASVWGFLSFFLFSFFFFFFFFVRVLLEYNSRLDNCFSLTRLGFRRVRNCTCKVINKSSSSPVSKKGILHSYRNGNILILFLVLRTLWRNDSYKYSGGRIRKMPVLSGEDKIMKKKKKKKKKRHKHLIWSVNGICETN